MMNESPLTSNTKIGFHYFQDTAHYTNKDLNTWMPEMVKMNARWVILLSDSSRAIPEQFIDGLITANITPIIHFPFRLPNAPTPADVHALFEAYSHWGVKYVVLFDRPNQINSWSPASWSQQDLVERFIDRFLPLANEALKAGLIPVFPPLEPGGDYWDTSFLRSALTSIKRRGALNLLNKMAYAVATYTFGRDLTWGSGGPDQWQKSKPYNTPVGSEDQCGFNACQWTEAIAKSIGLSSVNIFQVNVGSKTRNDIYSPVIHAELTQEILSKIGTPEYSSILGSMFWLLSADQGTAEFSQAWIKPNGSVLPIVKVLSNSLSMEENIPAPAKKNVKNEPPNSEYPHPIDHYLLLPSYEWGVADWHLEVTRPFVIKHHPTVGYSIEEAQLAKKVTVIGGDQDFSPDLIAHLRNIGCEVEQISGDGTSIATTLSQR